jgi:regulator of replication initiation timing
MLLNGKNCTRRRKKRVVELDAKIDHLYAEITKYRDAIRELSEKNSELAVQNQALEFRKCNKHGCADRVPPSEY